MSTQIPGEGGPESTGEVEATRRSRAGEGGSPVGSTLSILLAIAAVVIGFVILRQIRNDDDTTSPGITTPDSQVDSSSTTSSTVDRTTTTTTIPLVKEGATVVVANANTIDGSAGQMSKALEAEGFTMGTPVNAAGAEAKLEATKVYYVATIPAAQAVADSVARVLGGGVVVAQIGSPAPVDTGSIGDAGVLLMLGSDKAGKTLAQLAPTTVAPNVTAPEVAGTTTTTVAGD